MKRFQFRLDSILRFREIEQNKALNNYAQAIRLRQNTQNQYEQGMVALQSLYETIVASRGTSFTAAEQKALYNSKKSIIFDNQKQYSNLMALQQAEKDALQEVLNRKSKVDVLLKLKERQSSAHTEEGLKQEEKAIESLIYNRNNTLNSLE